ncbi:hypothetical protein HRR83_004590 [Exophiala dermatitidis]|uniref:Uncharacterized protein n=1 Tax=Exophiala dermatitidis TaxID=5970 RepID=A0AAN6EZB1_EXODE|nr:hypothetical protein HRR75_003783 [Exophiala dermatitidis]KAJ4519386.1 hypothetical protein HRR74_004129 [Exophiala dermatitidis]KAJ4529202.1 hypothetical protein HRR73_000224 [Exophiala dermatitidis]KAJ4544152.1 hypothetical protein HRR76_002218 [Exophiala dermatitidis]KAJ4557774.1 hypothetical protein HRR78_001447 [Exophiala dermatitidis]
MSFVSRGARAALRPVRRSVRHQPRRYAGHEAGHGHGETHHGESALHVDAGPRTEHFGKGFYITIAAVPLAILWYSAASSPGDNAWSRLVKKYEAGKQEDARANIIHTTMMEAAAADRQLFSSSPRDDSGSPLRMPETMNFGSPWNVSAGRGTADLSELAKFYEERDRKAERARLQRLKENNGVSIYD